MSYFFIWCVMKKINVIGTSASGKTTFSRKLAQKLNLNYIELDDLLWMDDWQETADGEFFQKLRMSMGDAKHGYVIDGNYSRTTHITWQEIDTAIWLDLPFHINLFRSVKRAVNRSLFRKKLWQSSNNKESFSRVLSRDSIILWMIKTHQKNRRKYLEKMNDPQYSHIRFIHLKSTKEIEQFLENSR